MGVGIDHRAQPCHPGRDQLLADIRPAIDHDSDAAIFNQNRRTAASVLRVGGSASPPIATDQRNAGGAAGPENRDPHDTGAGIRLKRRRKFSVVRAASSSTGMPLTSATTAAVWATKAGSLRLPRLGIGARNGASVSTRIRSSGTVRTMSRNSSDFRKVTMPDREI